MNSFPCPCCNKPCEILFNWRTNKFQVFCKEGPCPSQVCNDGWESNVSYEEAYAMLVTRFESLPQETNTHQPTQ